MIYLPWSKCTIMSLISYGSSRLSALRIGSISCHIIRRSTSCGSTIPDSVKSLAENVFKGDRRSLSQSITLLESTHPTKRKEGQFILSLAMNLLAERESNTGQYTLRIGLSGPPGAGKSTFIEALGSRLTGSLPWIRNLGESSKKSSTYRKVESKPVPIPTDKHRVAVLAVDPSSQTTGGSLLADKTRMHELSHDLNAYVRPSPSGGNLGGVARSTNEIVLLCEASGYDVVLVETVGVGQSETAVVDMVDLFVLLIPPAGGDELQGIKRGIVEYADIVLVNKADGDLMAPARRIATEYSNALRYQRQRRLNWRPEVMLVSSYEGTGIPEFWNRVLQFKQEQIDSGELQRVRKKQLKVWMWNYVKEGIWENFRSHPRVCGEIAQIEQQVISGEIPPGRAAETLIQMFAQKS